MAPQWYCCSWTLDWTFSDSERLQELCIQQVPQVFHWCWRWYRCALNWTLFLNHFQFAGGEYCIPMRLSIELRAVVPIPRAYIPTIFCEQHQRWAPDPPLLWVGCLQLMPQENAMPLVPLLHVCIKLLRILALYVLVKGGQFRFGLL